MNLKKYNFPAFIFLSIISLFVWIRFSYPQLEFINLTVRRNTALNIAEDYLNTIDEQGLKGFKSSAIFSVDTSASRFLQRTLGFYGLKKFIRNYDFDLFFWEIRFFKEKQKEEYIFNISSSTGEIISFYHIIDETDFRKEIPQKQAKDKAENFIKDNFDFDLKKYSIITENKKKLDNRIDYYFRWKNDSVDIKWDGDKNKGTGKLESGLVISGDDILSFYKNSFNVPDQFTRELKNKESLGANITSIVSIFYYILFISSIYFVIARRSHIVMHVTKKFYLGVVIISFVLSLASYVNNYELILSDYDTTMPFNSYLFNLTLNSVIIAFFIALTIIMPSLAGESFHYEVIKENKKGSFLHYIKTTFLSRSVSYSIFLGYLVCILMLGIQSLLIQLGQRFFNVWIEYDLISQLSTSYLPFLAAFTIGFKASLSEELTFRLFSISWGKKLFKSLIISVIFSSMIWGFAHSNYPVFPMWFRGFEVTIIGFFLSFIYLKYGLITVIVAHYLFDVFWSSAGYLMGHTNTPYFISSLTVLLVPFAFGLTAFLINKKEVINDLKWKLNKNQLYNLEILKTYLESKKILESKSIEKIREEIISKGWDAAVVETALEDLKKK